MPTYTFRNTTTNEEWEETMSMSAREIFLKDNPHIQQLLTSIRIGDPFFLGRVHADSNVNNRIKEIKSKHRGSTIRTGNITEV